MANLEENETGKQGENLVRGMRLGRTAFRGSLSKGVEFELVLNRVSQAELSLSGLRIRALKPKSPGELENK